MNMNTTMKNVLGIVLVAVVSSGLTIGANAYMNRQHANVATVDNSYGFNQPLRLTNYSGVAAENTDFTMAAERSVHAVVHIKSVTEVQVSGGQYMDPFEFFFGNGRGNQPRQPQKRVGAGSGVIISTDGYIITNNHVIDGASELEVTLNDNRKFKAKVIGSDPSTDIALIKVDAKDLPTIPFGDSEQLKVGEWVLAVGNPFNLTSTVTAGIVSAKGRSIDLLSRNSRTPIESFIQTDAAINPGNSGGALVNTNGDLIGINSAISSNTGYYEGYGFAVPANLAKKVVEDIKKFGLVQRGFLGVGSLDLSDEDQVAIYNSQNKTNIKPGSGIFVREVTEKSGAEDAGIKKGDIITKIDNSKIDSFADLSAAIGSKRPGDKVTVSYTRDGRQLTTNVTLKDQKGNTSFRSKSDLTVSEKIGGEFDSLSENTKVRYGLDSGVLTKNITEGGELAKIGVQDRYVIMEVNGKPVNSQKDIEKILNGYSGNVQIKFVDDFGQIRTGGFKMP